MKYIIDLPEDHELVFSDGQQTKIIRPDKNEMVVFNECEDILKIGFVVKLTPYEEHDTAEQRGQEEAWTFAQKILAPPNNSDAMTAEDIMDCYGTDDAYDVVCGMTFAEASEKYEAWKKEKEEIKIGDEIRNGGVYGIVTLVEKKADGICYHVVGNDGYVWYLNDLVTKKTGRHFPEVADLLEKMREPEC